MDEKKFEELVNKQLIKNQLTAGAMTFNLSEDFGINLIHVTHFETVELEDEKGKPKGEFAPAICFVSGEMKILQENEAKIFRAIWNEYCISVSQNISLLKSLNPAITPTQTEEKN